MSEKVSKMFEGAEHIGGFEAEYAAFRETCALVVRGDRAAVAVSGERRAEMLNGLVSNQVRDLTDAGRHAFLLSAKGRVLTDMRVLPRSRDLLLDVPTAGIENALATLKKYLPPIYATFEDLSDGLRQVGVYGPEAAAAAQQALGLLPGEAHLAVAQLDVEDASALLVRNRRLASDGIEVWVSAGVAENLTQELLTAVEGHGGCAAGSRALEVVRIEAGIPCYGVDMTEANLAQETGLEEDAVSYNKGCYLGQEVVSRVHFRGHVNRRLMGLSFAERLADPGLELFQGEKSVGTVTSAVESPDFGPIGLGYVRREIDAGARLGWSDGSRSGEAVVSPLPFRKAAV